MFYNTLIAEVTNDLNAILTPANLPCAITALTVSNVINANQISINVKQSVSRIDTDIEASDVVFDQKALAATLQVKDGRTIYQRGLIDDSNEQIDQGVPLLRGFPLLSFLFVLSRNDQDKEAFSLRLKIIVL